MSQGRRQPLQVFLMQSAAEESDFLDQASATQGRCEQFDLRILWPIQDKHQLVQWRICGKPFLHRRASGKIGDHESFILA
ncbi:MAG: hypothetical protein ACRYF5_08360 [Janthinobacterium lividum]